MIRETPNLPINFQEQLAQEAAAITKRLEAPSGDRVRFHGRTFSTPDGKEGEELEVVVVDFISSNLFYEAAYSPSSPTPPTCFAMGPDPTRLIPSENSPKRQAQSCMVCPKNQFGSAGRAKACKNTRLVAMMPVSHDGEFSPLWIMSLPPTALKPFDSYVKLLALKYHTIPIGVVSRVTMDEKAFYPSPRFSVVRPLRDEEFETYVSRREEAKERLMVEPDIPQK